MQRISIRAIGGQASAIVNSAKPFMFSGEKEETEKRSAVKKDTSWRTTLIIIGLGVLLGRAVILLEMLPFVIPFLAVIFYWQRRYTLVTALALIAGSITVSIPFAGYTTMAVCLYLVFQALFQKHASKQQVIPFIVFMTVLTASYSTSILMHGHTVYHFVTALIEAGLALVVTMIFFQSIPLVMEKRKKLSLKHEEIVCLVILLASLMTGTVGWLIYQLSVEHILARYIVLVFAFVGGAAIGTTVGVVVGLILSLANVANLFYMSLLAFSGLLGGLLKEGKKVSVAFGLIVATLLMGMYGDNQVPLELSMYESLAAIALFIFTPKKWTATLSKYIPGTVEHSQEQQQYLRKIRDVTAGKVEQFSSLFLSLSKSFSLMEANSEKTDREHEVDLFLSKVTEKTCQTCMRKHQCWTRKFSETHSMMEQIMEECESEGDVKNRHLLTKWNRHCMIDDRVIEVIKKELSHYKASKQLKRQLLESRRLVADQLKGVSQVMEDFAKDIQREKKAHEHQEEEITQTIQRAGLDVELVEVYRLDPGNVDIEIVLSSNSYNESEKIVAPLLSDILQETITVKHTEPASMSGNEVRVTFGSTKRFVMEDGVAHAAKGGRWVSGDSFSTMELGAGKYAMAISDGMGNGERAHMESQETINLLKNILRSGIEETVAIKSINSVLSLRSDEEVFSTLDLAMVDLQDASVKFLKVGSIPSFIKRGDRVKSVESSNLPIGIIRELDVDVVTEELKAGDLLIMMSDGIYEAPNNIENKDVWLKRVIKEIETKNPQEVADLLMERVIRESGGVIHDDMTIIVSKMEHHTPQWATISVPQKEYA
ncbi:stage II sporulation protein E [Bacillus shivajii]|uniref:stage II sporulation protein E n=1 Tax=Bacillus shivajii TaxID=1983719 RepID=UPI001CFAC24C|nr:stage II sporulation protein E [Bacillus shivajii]UCZ53321.1 stage II sporulation protein E [Bacillus shivajii]